MTNIASYTHLLKISNNSLYEFLHGCVDDLLQKQSPNFENYKNRDIEWTEEDFDRTRAYIQNLYRQSVIDDTLDLPKDLTTDLQEAITRCYTIRKNDIFQALAKEFILQDGHNLVNNIDWRLKWVLGTSDLAALQEPRLQVDLHCSNKIGDKVNRNVLNFEANLEQIDGLISDLSKLQREFQ
ncbi:uncharacterized protein LOC108910502 [Anoplophora glabripennis]|uniref:uncharacterized protein LOC108910502 n=1 Tax=Anoplophora glabripennis TaxID=217634 RepID=UPI0008750AD0|nr:uncharacterized protein LOC108910502 [Anoplophora glabripennis]